MEIVSWQFLLFSGLVLGVYYLLSRRAQNIWLLAASYAFYLTWSWKYALVLVGMTLVNYWLGWQVESQPRGKSSWLWTGILVNGLSLFSLKALSSPYGASLLHTLGWQINWTEVLLPVGFSFYVLQNISYLVDVSRRQLPASRNLADFALYLVYFPKLLAGPIERARTFLPRLANPRSVDNTAIARSLSLIATGLVRKIVIADNLGTMMPPTIFSASADFTTTEHLLWLSVFAFKLYNDFAGYTSIVRGVSGLMGIELSANFQQPFFARSFSEFWNRWHISLSHWLRDYIFFPLSRWLIRRRRSSTDLLALAVPPLVTMLFSGYWHGAIASMVAWGGLHGVFQVGERLFPTRALPPEAGKGQKTLRAILSALVVFILTTLAWVPFATAGFKQAVQFWGELLPPFTGGISLNGWGWALIFIGLSLGMDVYQYRANDEAVFATWSRRAQVWSLALAIIAILLSVGTGAQLSGFVYQGF